MISVEQQKEMQAAMRKLEQDVNALIEDFHRRAGDLIEIELVGLPFRTFRAGKEASAGEYYQQYIHVKSIRFSAFDPSAYRGDY